MRRSVNQTVLEASPPDFQGEILGVLSYIAYVWSRGAVETRLAPNSADRLDSHIGL